MRITNSNTASSYLHNLQSNLQRMDKINNQLTSQSVINRVSDDPYNAIKVINLKSEISDVDKYNANCDELLGWAETTDSALDSIGTLTSEIKNLIGSISEIHSETEIKAIKENIKEKSKQIAELFNSSYAGQYIFAGTNTEDKPVTVTENPDGTLTIAKNPTANNGVLKGEVSQGISIEYNVTVDMATGNGELFDTLNMAIGELGKDPIDFDKIKELKEKMDNATDLIIGSRSTTGAKMNSIEKIKDNNTTNMEEMKKILSSIQDVDVSKKSVELKSAELAYVASLKVGAKLMENSLLDYIR